MGESVMPDASKAVAALLKVDRVTARLLLRSQAILAVIGGAIALKVDPWTLLLYGLVILLLTLLFIIVASISRRNRLLVWGALILLFLFLGFAVLGGIFNSATGLLPLALTTRDIENKDTKTDGISSWLKGIECIVRPFENCSKVQDAIASKD
jgi:hypothetical protein